MKEIFGTSLRSMFVCSLFYLLKYSSICYGEFVCRTLKSEHPNMTIQKLSLCNVMTLTRLSETKVEGGE